jgi:hypothetical protein
MSKFIKYVPVELLDDIHRGGCVPIVGAGFSKNAVLPPENMMPLWNDLGAEVARRMSEEPSGDPTDLLSKYCDHSCKLELVKLLRKCLHVSTAKPGRVHKEFAKLPFKEVLTTNFDFLLEKAYDCVGKTCMPVVGNELLSVPTLNGETKLIKIHGDLHHPSLMVVTQKDYYRFQNTRGHMFYYISHILAHNSILFIGYSIRDPDFRQIWQLVEEWAGEFRPPAYTILIGAVNGEVDEYRHKGVTKVISLPGSQKEYGRILFEVLREIGQAVNNSSSEELS